MFKVYGCIIFILSVTVLFNRDTIRGYYTCKTLKETIDLLQYIKLECNSGHTYPDIFESINKGLYCGFDITDIETSLNGFIADDKIKNELKIFFSQLGKRPVDKETEFIESYISVFKYYMKINADKHIKNAKANIIAGISLGMVIIIVLI